MNYELMEKHRDLVQQAQLPILMNLAACYLKPGPENDPTLAHQYCSDALNYEPENAKALYRRGQANLARHFVDEARADVLKAAKLLPKDAAIRKTLGEIQLQMAEKKVAVKKAFGGKLTDKDAAPGAVAGAGGKDGETTLQRLWKAWKIGGVVLLVAILVRAFGFK